jgi:UDP:flavonoid glycosyltransferase YjiC (YdhE family)
MEKISYTYPAAPTLPALPAGAKILFANMPADGHFNPLTGLAMHLKSIGHDVRWYSAATYAGKIKKLNIPYFPFVKAKEVNGHNIDESFPERTKYKSQLKKLKYDLVHFFILRSEEYFADLQEIHRVFPFDVLIADSCFTAIPMVKDKMQVPVLAIGIIPLPETSKDLAPSGLGMTPAQGYFGKRKQDVLRFVADNILFRWPNKVMRELLNKHQIKVEGNLFDVLIRKSSLVLQIGAPGFDYKRSDMSENVRYVGALLPYQATGGKTQWFNEKLLHYEKVILVTQGTVEKDVEKIIVPTLEAFKNTSHLVIATTGGSNTAALRERYPQANILIEDFIPFNDVMPYADVYVTNGGYGGVMLSVKNKLPMVVAGVNEGKNEINARVGYFKLGINLKTEHPTPRQVQQAVQAVLGGDIYSRQLHKLSTELSHYNPLKLCAAYVSQIVAANSRGQKQHNNRQQRIEN